MQATCSGYIGVEPNYFGKKVANAEVPSCPRNLHFYATQVPQIPISTAQPKGVETPSQGAQDLLFH